MDKEALLQRPDVAAEYQYLSAQYDIETAERYLAVTAKLDKGEIKPGSKPGPNYNRCRVGQRVENPTVSPRG